MLDPYKIRYFQQPSNSHPILANVNNITGLDNTTWKTLDIRKASEMIRQFLEDIVNYKE